MKNRHLRNEEDITLHKLIYKDVRKQLILNPRKVKIILTFKFLLYFSISSFMYFLILNVNSILGLIGSYIGFGMSMVLIAFNFAHDLSHNTVFKSKKINNVAYTFIYTLVGAHADAWKQRHVNAHHFAPNVVGQDPDLNITKLIRVIPGSEYFWFHRYQYIYAPFAYTIYSLFWIFIKDFILLYQKDDYPEFKKWNYHLIFWIQKIGYLVIILGIPLIYSNQVWSHFLIAFILMHLTQSLFLLFTFFITHHVQGTYYPKINKNGIIELSWLKNQIKSSNDILPFSRTANFILGGFNNHIAHHLFPHIHHVYYPEINKLLYTILENHGIVPNQTTYFGGIISHLQILKQRGISFAH